MEEVSAEKLAEQVLDQFGEWADPTNDSSAVVGFSIINERFLNCVTEAIQTATQRERERIDSLCRQLEFTNNFMKTRIEDSLTLRALLKDNQELVDQVRLER